MVDDRLFLKEEWRIGRIKQKFPEHRGWIWGKVHEFSKQYIYIYVYISSRIYENRTIGHQEPTHLKLTQLK